MGIKMNRSNFTISSLLLPLLSLLIYTGLSNGQEAMECEDLFRGLARNLPCICVRDMIYNETIVNCDNVAFFGEFPVLPFRQRIVAFSQQYSGVQNLEPQLFTAADIPLRKVDFSHNLLRRLMERTFYGIEMTLNELILGHNLLGDQLNPIFSTNEFLQLTSLKVLDLSYNQIRALDSNLFRGLKNISVLHLEGNELVDIPSSSLYGLTTLRSLQIGHNYITALNSGIFPSSLASLKVLNLSSNPISYIQNGAFSGLQQLSALYLSNNNLKTLNTQIFSVLSNLEILDLTNNFLDYFPGDAIEGMRRIKRLHFGSNNIQTIDENAFREFQMLEYLDLSRNSLSILSPNTFNGLSKLRELNLAYNAIRKLDDGDENIFRELSKLEILDMTDCQISQFPSVSLNQLMALRKLILDYNNIGIVSEEMLNSVSQLEELSIAYNLIRELPDGLFRNFKNLKLLNLHGNRIDFVSQEVFEGISDNLIGLDMGFNDITEWPTLALPKLFILSITMNQLGSIGDAFRDMPSLGHLNVSFNQILHLPVEVFRQNKLLEHIDLEANAIHHIDRSTFNNASLVKINLRGNRIRELSHSSFEDLWMLQYLDLSSNEIANIKNGAFDELPSLKILDLSKNYLASFKGDFFTSRTQIETLDLSDNLISYLYPNSFVIHRKLRKVNLRGNKLTFFPIEIINSIRSLRHINLAHNKLQSVNSGDFANMPRLRILELNNNEINEIETNAFGNSSQLQWLFLQYNGITHLEERTFKGIGRLNIDLSYNNITSLPGDVFERHNNVFQLESINLSGNSIIKFPVSSLKKQYSFLERANLSHNRIQHLPSNSDVLVNVKELDLSYNPLSFEAHSVLFGEPKSVRRLSVAATNIETLPSVIESPFLKELSLSKNAISKVKSTAFERTSLLRVLDLSHNKITNLNTNMEGVWNVLSQLRQLILSFNPIQYIVKGDFDELINLERLDLSNLPSLIHFDCEALSRLHQLKEIHLFGYPTLNFLEVHECLGNINNKLEKLAVEMKENNLQGHLQRAFSSRINEISITGDRLTSLSPSSLAGIKSPRFKLKVQQTSLNSIPPSLFASLPLSSNVEVDLDHNSITNLNSQLVNSLDSKQMHVKLTGLNHNPLMCDCNMHSLWKFINEKMKSNMNAKYYKSTQSFWNLTCSSPSHLRGHRLIDLGYDDLICGDITIKVTTPVPILTTRRTTPLRKTPDIIFELPQTKRPYPGLKGVLSRANERRQNLTKFDTVVIGIVAGVCAFVVILILIVCVVRLRSASPTYPQHHPPPSIPCSIVRGPSGHHHCTCLKPPHSTASCYAPSFYSGTLPHPSTLKMLTVAPSLTGPAFGTLGRIPTKTPYYITYPESDHENR